VWGPRCARVPGYSGVDYEVRWRGCRNLTGDQCELAGRLAARAELLRDEAGRDGGKGLVMAQAVLLAAVQLGLQPAPTDN
jgi:hypothetical protein